jgi:mxaJ protein
MSSRCRSSLALVLLAAAGCRQGPRAVAQAAPWDVAPTPPPPPSVPARPAVLRVCADPNNLPFSNQRREGFENRIAALIARDFGARLEYTWLPQRRGFIRNTLKAKRCDVVVGVPAGYELAATTAPYYRSTYVFVYRADRGLDIRSFDDSALRHVKIGVPLVGDDGANPPPAHALAARGITQNVVGYTVYGDYRTEAPPARLIHAVAHGDIDVAIAWGPLAGYFARREGVPLKVVPVSPQVDLPNLPFVFDIAMGVRRGETVFQAALDSLIRRERPAIDRILSEYGVPRT